MRAVGRSARVAAAVGVPLAIVVACWSPTEIEVDVYTDIPCMRGRTQTQMFLSNDDDAIATAEGCEEVSSSPQGSRVGSFVLAPRSGQSGEVEVEIALTTDATKKTAFDCHKHPTTAPDVGAQCVIARRSVSFERHASRFLTVRLYEKCLGVDCGQGLSCEPTETGTRCADTHDFGTTSDPCPSCTSDADPGFSSDAAAFDAAVLDGSTLDAPVDTGTMPGPCTGPLGDGIIVDGIDAPRTRLAYDPESNLVVWVATTAGADVLMAMPAAGGPPYAVKHLIGASALTVALDARGGRAWIARQNAVVAEPLSTGITGGTWFAAGSVAAIAVGGGEVYLAEPGGTGAVEAMPADGTSGPMPKYTPAGSGVAVTKDTVYHSDGTEVYREPIGGGAQSKIAEQVTPGITAVPTGTYAATCSTSGDFVLALLPYGGATLLSSKVTLPCRLAFTPSGTALVWPYLATIRRYGGPPNSVIGDTQVYPDPAIPTANAIPPIQGVTTDGACLFFWTQSTVGSGKATMRVAPLPP